MKGGVGGWVGGGGRLVETVERAAEEKWHMGVENRVFSLTRMLRSRS